MPGHFLPRVTTPREDARDSNGGNPYECFVSANVAGTRQAAKNMTSKGYILSAGGGYTSLVPGSAFVQTPIKVKKGHRRLTQSTKGFRAQKGPPKTLGRILKRLAKKKDTIATFWMDHTVSKWKHTFMLLVLRAWRFVATQKHREEEKVLTIINHVRGNGVRHWFSLWVRFMQGSQRTSLKEKRKKMSLDLMKNLRDLEMKQADAMHINTTLEKDLEFAEKEVQILKGKLLVSQKHERQLEVEHKLDSQKIESMEKVFQNEETSTPMLVQRCKASVKIFDVNIGPVCVKQVEEASKILTYLVQRNNSPNPWLDIVRLVPFVEVETGADQKSFTGSGGDLSIKDEQGLESLFQSISPRTFATAWINFHFSRLQNRFMDDSASARIVRKIPDDLMDGIVWSAVLDSVVDPALGEKTKYKRNVWQKTRERERVRELLSNFKKLGIFSASKLRTAVLFKKGSPGEHFAIVEEVMRKFPALHMDASEAVEALALCKVVQKRISDLLFIRRQISNAVTNASKIDISTEAGKKKVENMFDELDGRASSFERNMHIVVEQVGEICSKSTHMLAAWPHALNLWSEGVLSTSIYSCRVLLIEQGREVEGNGLAMEGTRSTTDSGMEDSSTFSDNPNGAHLRRFSKIPKSRLQNITTSICLTREDYKEIEAMLRLQSPNFAKLFIYYSAYLNNSGPAQNQTGPESAKDPLDSAVSLMQFWWMLVDAGMVRRLPADVLLGCFSRAKQMLGDEAVSFGNSNALSRTEFAEAVVRLSWALFPGNYLSDSVPTLLDEILSNESMFPAVPSYSRLREFSLSPTFLKILEGHESSLFDQFTDYANQTTERHGCLMTANALVDYMKEKNAINVRVTERFVRLGFARTTAHLPHSGFTRHPDSEMGVLSITYIQFVHLFITFFLADEGDPYSPLTEAFDQWLKLRLIGVDDDSAAASDDDEE